MNVIYLADSRPVLKLAEGTARKPCPGRGELLIRVKAAGVTTTELEWYPTTHNRSGDVRLRAIPGHEFSGLVEENGPETEKWFRNGQEVFGMNDWYADGAMAQFCLTEPAALTAKPTKLTHIEAASVPIGGLTAWQGLFDHAMLKAGDRLLVHGGAGAVGGFAVQLGRLTGAHVTATASARNMEFVRDLGADEVIDYRGSRFEETAGQMDVVFDTVGGETFERSWKVLKPNGRMVTVVADAENSSKPKYKDVFFIVKPDGKQLTTIADLLVAERLRAIVDTVFPLSQTPDVFRGVSPRRGRGKLVISMDGNSQERRCIQ